MHVVNITFIGFGSQEGWITTDIKTYITNSKTVSTHQLSDESQAAIVARKILTSVQPFDQQLLVFCRNYTWSNSVHNTPDCTFADDNVQLCDWR